MKDVNELYQPEQGLSEKCIPFAEHRSPGWWGSWSPHFEFLRCIKEKTVFMTDCDNFFYEIIPFGLKIVRASYQWPMDQIFKGMLNWNVKVYVEYIVVKFDSCAQHIQDLKEVSQISWYATQSRQVCVQVEGGKFFRFMLTHRGTKANPEKCRAITKMWTLKNIKEIQKWIGWLTTLSRFVPKLEKIKVHRPTLMKSSKVQLDTWMWRNVPSTQNVFGSTSDHTNIGCTMTNNGVSFSLRRSH